MFNRMMGKSNEKKQDESSNLSRRSEDNQHRRRRQSESVVSSTSARKSSRGDDRDRGFNSTSIDYSDAPRNPYQGTTSASIASSYVTAVGKPADITVLPPDLVRNSTLINQVTKQKSRREERKRDEDEKQRGDRRRERSTSRDRNTRRSGSLDRDNRTRERKDRRDRKRDEEREKERVLSRSESDYMRNRGVTRTESIPISGSGGFSAQIGGSAFTQFPGQYDSGLPSFPTRPVHHEMSAHVQDQFPGQFPTESTAPYRPPLGVNEGGPGLATEYYGDAGESVAYQPGVRPQPPSLIVGAEPHLQAALAVAAPPPEPSASGSVGAAASFYSTTENFQSPSMPASNIPANQPRPGNPNQSSRISRPAAMAEGAALGHITASHYDRVNDQVPPNYPNGVINQQSSHMPISPNNVNHSTNGRHSTSVPVLPTLAAGAAGAAAGYMAGNISSSHRQDSIAQKTSTVSYSSNIPSASQRPQNHTAASQEAYITTEHNQAAGRHSSHSSKLPSYALGAAGIAAAEYRHNQNRYDSYGNTYSAQGHPSGSMAQRHRHHGPLDKFVEFWKDPDGVAQFEEYTEYIGVCTYCFAPGSTPRDAPRKHHYRQRRRSNEYNGSSIRVDKDSRYSSSSDGEIRRKSKNSWLATGLAGYGLAKIGKNFFSTHRDKNEVYGQQRGRVHKSSTSLRGRQRSSSTERRSYTSRGVIRRSDAGSPNRNRSHENVETGISGDGKIYGRQSYPVAPGRLTTSTHDSKVQPRSRSRSRERKTGINEAAVGASIASAASVSSLQKDSGPRKSSVHSMHESRERDSELGPALRTVQSTNGHNGHLSSHLSRRSSSAYVEVRRSDIEPSTGILSEVFPSTSDKNRSHQKKRRNNGFFNFGNGSSSSTDSALAFGSRSDLSRRSRKKSAKPKEKAHGNSSAALLGLGTAAVLAANDVRKHDNGKRRAELVALENAKDQHKRISRPDHKKIISSSAVDEDAWESASEEDDVASIDSTLAYGMHRRSHESLRSDSSGTEKWGWRWGGKTTKESSPLQRHFPTGSAGGQLGAAAGAILASDHQQRQPKSDQSELPPLQHVYPIATSDPSHYDVVVQHATITTNEPLVTARPAPIPLQQPQPIAQVPSAVYATHAPYGHSYSAPSGPPVMSQLSYQHDPISSIKPHVETVQANVQNSFSPYGYSFEAVHKNAPRNGDSGRQESPLPLKSNYTSDSRRVSAHEDASAVRFKMTKELEDRQRQDRLRQGKEEKEARRIAEMREVEEQAELERERQRSNKTSQEAIYDKAGRLEQIDRELEMLEKQGPGAKLENSIAWNTTLAGVTGAAIGAAVIKSDERIQKQSKMQAEQRRDPADQNTFIENCSVTVEEDFERTNRAEQEAKIARQAAAKIRKTASPLHENYASYFAPPELSKAAEHSNPSATSNTHLHPDDETDSNRMSSTLPWHLPRIGMTLNLIQPTPPASIAGSTKGGSSPLVRAEDITEPVVEIFPKSRSNSRVTFSEPDIHEYDVLTPEEHRDEFIGSYEVLREAEKAQAEDDIKEPMEPINNSSGNDSPIEEVPRVRRMPGQFGDDIDFAATVAAGLEHTGFDPDIVIDDPTFRRRDSPPGSESFGYYHGPFATGLSDLRIDSPGTEGAPPVRGFVIGELPETPKEDTIPRTLAEEDETRSRLSEREKKEKEKATKREDTESIVRSAADLVKPAFEDEIIHGSPVFKADIEEAKVDAKELPEIFDPEVDSIRMKSKSESKKHRKSGSEHESRSLDLTGEREIGKDEYFDATDLPRPATESVQQMNIEEMARNMPLPDDKDGSPFLEQQKTFSEVLNEMDGTERLDSPSEEIASNAASEPVLGDYQESRKHRKKSKRRTTEFNDAASLVSAPAVLDDTRTSNSKSKKEKKKGVFGLFRRSTDDFAGTTGSKDSPTETAYENSEERKKKSRKSKERRSARDEDDLYNLASSSTVDVARLDDEEGSIRARKAKDNGDREKRRDHRDSRGDEDSGRITQDLPAKVYVPVSPGRTPEISIPASLTDPENRERAADVLEPNIIAPIQPSISDEQKSPMSFLGERQEPKRPPDILGAESLTEQPSVEQSSPGSQLSSPTLAGSIEGLPSLPADPHAFSDTPPLDLPKRLSMLRLTDPNHPNTSVSSTAIPINLRTPRSAGFSRSSPSTPAASSENVMHFTPRQRQPRPSSTEFKSSTEFRPLWLVERHSSRQVPVTDEIYPSLPSSHSTSRASSVHGATEVRDPFQDVPPGYIVDASPLAETSSLRIDTDKVKDSDLLDSQQTTPTVASFQSRSMTNADLPEIKFLPRNEIADIQAGDYLHDPPQRITHPVDDFFLDRRPQHGLEHHAYPSSPQTDKAVERDLQTTVKDAVSEALVEGAATTVSHSTSPHREHSMEEGTLLKSNDEVYSVEKLPEDPEDETQPADDPDFPLTAKVKKKKSKKQRKASETTSKQDEFSTKGTSSQPSGIRMDIEDRRKLEEYNSQDAVDSWSAPNTSKKAKKEMKGRKSRYVDMMEPKFDPKQPAEALAATGSSNLANTDPDYITDKDGGESRNQPAEYFGSTDLGNLDSLNAQPEHFKTQLLSKDMSSEAIVNLMAASAAATEPLRGSGDSPVLLSQADSALHPRSPFDGQETASQDRSIGENDAREALPTEKSLSSELERDDLYWIVPSTPTSGSSKSSSKNNKKRRKKSVLLSPESIMHQDELDGNKFPCVDEPQADHAIKQEIEMVVSREEGRQGRQALQFNEPQENLASASSKQPESEHEEEKHSLRKELKLAEDEGLSSRDTDEIGKELIDSNKAEPVPVLAAPDEIALPSDDDIDLRDADQPNPVSEPVLRMTEESGKTATSLEVPFQSLDESESLGAAVIMNKDIHTAVETDSADIEKLLSTESRTAHNSPEEIALPEDQDLDLLDALPENPISDSEEMREKGHPSGLIERILLDQREPILESEELQVAPPLATKDLSLYTPGPDEKHDLDEALRNMSLVDDHAVETGNPSEDLKDPSSAPLDIRLTDKESLDLPMEALPQDTDENYVAASRERKETEESNGWSGQLGTLTTDGKAKVIEVDSLVDPSPIERTRVAQLGSSQERDFGRQTEQINECAGPAKKTGKTSKKSKKQRLRNEGFSLEAPKDPQVEAPADDDKADPLLSANAHSVEVQSIPEAFDHEHKQSGVSFDSNSLPEDIGGLKTSHEEGDFTTHDQSISSLLPIEPISRIVTPGPVQGDEWDYPTKKGEKPKMVEYETFSSNQNSEEGSQASAQLAAMGRSPDQVLGALVDRDLSSNRDPVTSVVASAPDENLGNQPVKKRGKKSKERMGSEVMDVEGSAIPESTRTLSAEYGSTSVSDPDTKLLEDVSTKRLKKDTKRKQRVRSTAAREDMNISEPFNLIPAAEEPTSKEIALPTFVDPEVKRNLTVEAEGVAAATLDRDASNEPSLYESEVFGQPQTATHELIPEPLMEEAAVTPDVPAQSKEHLFSVPQNHQHPERESILEQAIETPLPIDDINEFLEIDTLEPKAFPDIIRPEASQEEESTLTHEADSSASYGQAAPSEAFLGNETNQLLQSDNDSKDNSKSQEILEESKSESLSHEVAHVLDDQPGHVRQVTPVFSPVEFADDDFRDEATNTSLPPGLGDDYFGHQPEHYQQVEDDYDAIGDYVIISQPKQEFGQAHDLSPIDSPDISGPRDDTAPEASITSLTKDAVYRQIEPSETAISHEAHSPPHQETSPPSLPQLLKGASVEEVASSTLPHDNVEGASDVERSQAMAVYKPLSSIRDIARTQDEEEKPTTDRGSELNMSAEEDDMAIIRLARQDLTFGEAMTTESIPEKIPLEGSTMGNISEHYIEADVHNPKTQKEQNLGKYPEILAQEGNNEVEAFRDEPTIRESQIEGAFSIVEIPEQVVDEFDNSVALLAKKSKKIEKKKAKRSQASDWTEEYQKSEIEKQSTPAPRDLSDTIIENDVADSERQIPPSDALLTVKNESKDLETHNLKKRKDKKKAKKGQVLDWNDEPGASTSENLESTPDPTEPTEDTANEIDWSGVSTPLHGNAKEGEIEPTSSENFSSKKSKKEKRKGKKSLLSKRNDEHEGEAVGAKSTTTVARELGDPTELSEILDPQENQSDDTAEVTFRPEEPVFSNSKQSKKDKKKSKKSKTLSWIEQPDVSNSKKNSIEDTDVHIEDIDRQAAGTSGLETPNDSVDIFSSAKGKKKKTKGKKSQMVDWTEPEPVIGLKFGSKSELELEPESESAVEAKAERVLEPETEREVGSGPEPAVEPESESMPLSEPHHVYEPEPQPVLESVSHPILESEPERVLEPKAENMVEPDYMTNPEHASELEYKSMIEPELIIESDTTLEPKPALETGASMEPKLAYPVEHESIVVRPKSAVDSEPVTQSEPEQMMELEHESLIKLAHAAESNDIVMPRSAAEPDATIESERQRPLEPELECAVEHERTVQTETEHMEVEHTVQPEDGRIIESKPVVEFEPIIDPETEPLFGSQSAHTTSEMLKIPQAASGITTEGSIEPQENNTYNLEADDPETLTLKKSMNGKNQLGNSSDRIHEPEFNLYEATLITSEDKYQDVPDLMENQGEVSSDSLSKPDDFRLADFEKSQNKEILVETERIPHEDKKSEILDRQEVCYDIASPTTGDEAGLVTSDTRNAEPYNGAGPGVDDVASFRMKKTKKGKKNGKKNVSIEDTQAKELVPSEDTSEEIRSGIAQEKTSRSNVYESLRTKKSKKDKKKAKKEQTLMEEQEPGSTLVDEGSMHLSAEGNLDGRATNVVGDRPAEEPIADPNEADSYKMKKSKKDKQKSKKARYAFEDEDVSQPNTANPEAELPPTIPPGHQQSLLAQEEQEEVGSLISTGSDQVPNNSRELFPMISEEHEPQKIEQYPADLLEIQPRGQSPRLSTTLDQQAHEALSDDLVMHPHMRTQHLHQEAMEPHHIMEPDLKSAVLSSEDRRPTDIPTELEFGYLQEANVPERSPDPSTNPFLGEEGVIDKGAPTILQEEEQDTPLIRDVNFPDEASIDHHRETDIEQIDNNPELDLIDSTIKNQEHLIGEPKIQRTDSTEQSSILQKLSNTSLPDDPRDISSGPLQDIGVVQDSTTIKSLPTSIDSQLYPDIFKAQVSSQPASVEEPSTLHESTITYLPGNFQDASPELPREIKTQDHAVVEALPPSTESQLPPTMVETPISGESERATDIAETNRSVESKDFDEKENSFQPEPGPSDYSTYTGEKSKKQQPGSWEDSTATRVAVDEKNPNETTDTARSMPTLETHRASPGLLPVEVDEDSSVELYDHGMEAPPPVKELTASKEYVYAEGGTSESFVPHEEFTVQGEGPTMESLYGPMEMTDTTSERQVVSDEHEGYTKTSEETALDMSIHDPDPPTNFLPDDREPDVSQETLHEDGGTQSTNPKAGTFEYHDSYKGPSNDFQAFPIDYSTQNPAQQQIRSILVEQRPLSPKFSINTPAEANVPPFNTESEAPLRNLVSKHPSTAAQDQGERTPTLDKPEEPWDLQITKKSKRAKRSKKQTDKSNLPGPFVQESKATDEAPDVLDTRARRSLSGKRTLSEVGGVGAGIALFESLQKADSSPDSKKSKKKRKESQRSDGDETTENALVLEERQAQDVPIPAPIPHTADQDMKGVEEYSLPKHEPPIYDASTPSMATASRPLPLEPEHSTNRDSGVHISDSPLLPEPTPIPHSLRDSGYQGADDSPTIDLNTETSKHATNDYDPTSPHDKPFTHGHHKASRAYEKAHTSDDTEQSSTAESSENPLKISIKVDPTYDVSISRPERHQSYTRLDRDNSSESIDRHPSPVDSTSKDRSSILFESSPSTREDGAIYRINAIASPPNPHTSRGESMLGGSTGVSRSVDTPKQEISPPNPEGYVQQAQPESLFGGPIGFNSDIAPVSSPPRSPFGTDSSSRRKLDTITEYSPEESPLHQKSRDVGAPEHGVKALRRSETPQGFSQPRIRSPLGIEPQSNKMISTDELLSRMSWPVVDEDNHAVDIDRNISRNTSSERRASSRHSHVSLTAGDPSRNHEAEKRSFSGASVRSGESIRAIIRSPDGLDTRSPATPPLRRVDRSISGDLRGASKREAKKLAKQAETGPESQAPVDPAIASSSTYDPVTDKGKARIIPMTDVYEGWGDVQGSPRSPTRPPSIRRHQSMQILDLETRLDQLVSENRLLQEAKTRAERSLDDASHNHDRDRNGLKEAIETRDLWLRQKDAELDELRGLLDGLQHEVSQLTEVNEGLTGARSEFAAEHQQRYNELAIEHTNTHRQWQESTKELEQLKQKHTTLASGMEGIVRHEINLALDKKNTEIRELRNELLDAKEQVRRLQQEILASKPNDDFLINRDEDYFDNQCQQLCQHVQQWVLRFSKFSDMRPSRTLADVADDRITDRFDNAILDGSDVDVYLSDRVKRRDVFMSVVMTMVWEYIFTRYLFGMDREQRQKLKSLEKTLAEVAPLPAVHKWRATTLAMLSRREAFVAQRAQDTEAVVQEIYDTLAVFLPPPSHLVNQIQESLRNVMRTAIDLAIEMRTQKAEYIMLPPLQPEYDINGDLVRKVYFNASLMNERSGDTTSNEELSARQAVVRMVLFPLVVKKGDDQGQSDEEIVICPAQVLVAKENDGRSNKNSKTRSISGGDRMEGLSVGNRSVQSFAPSSMDPGIGRTS